MTVFAMAAHHWTNFAALPSPIATTKVAKRLPGRDMANFSLAFFHSS
jgi:hypothetical protein